MKKPLILMKDVAKVAGVHQTTVSLALRNHPGLPESTRNRIKKIAHEMGYRHDPVLTALGAYRKRTKETPIQQRIAWIINVKDPNRLSRHHVHQQLFEGANDRASELGYKLEKFWFGHEYVDSKTLNNALIERSVQGVILGALDARAETIDLDWNRFSVVKISQVPYELPFESILSNQIEAVALAMGELKRIGIRRIGLAISDFEERVNRFTFGAGYHTHHRYINAADYVPPMYFKHGPDYEEDVLPTVTDWARTHKVEAILSNWNNICQVAETLSEEGYDCRFVPLDANEDTRSLGGVNQDHYLTGHHAIEMTVGKMVTFRKGFEESPPTTMVSPVLIPIKDTQPA